MVIKNVIICGLGALGMTYADKLKDVCNLKILADETRITRYKQNTPTINNKVLELNYTTPEESWDTDLIIISTKASGLSYAIKNIKNYVGKNTIIISLINGISSEKEIARVYGKEKVLHSFFIGHSAMRFGNSTNQDGIGKVVIERNNKLESFFSKHKINYEVVDDILYAQWIKLGVNIVLNQLSAIYNKNIGNLKKVPEFNIVSKTLIQEIIMIAEKEGLNTTSFEKDVLASINLIADDGKTSMLQDIILKRKTEVEIFSGEIIKLGKKHNILTPCNEEIYNKIREIEKGY